MIFNDTNTKIAADSIDVFSFYEVFCEQHHL